MKIVYLDFVTLILKSFAKPSGIHIITKKSMPKDKILSHIEILSEKHHKP
jgi:hypothetical protein